MSDAPNIAKLKRIEPDTIKLAKLEHIEPDTIPDATDYNNLVDVANAMAEVINLLGQQVEVLSDWRDTEIYIGRHGLK